MAPPTPPTGPEQLERDYRERMGLRGKEEYSERLDSRDALSSITNKGPILRRKSGREEVLLRAAERLVG